MFFTTKNLWRTECGYVFTKCWRDPIPFRLSDEIGRIRELMNWYQNVPMSLADGCLVRMSELIKGSCVLTLDSDFRVYRKNRNEMVDLIIADEL